MTSRYPTLEDVIQDPAFPEVDVALRRGRHIDREDGDSYQLLVDAQEHLRGLYGRYHCELHQPSDGYFYLLPVGEQLPHRHLSRGEMLLGQALALAYLDPAHLRSGGSFERTQFLVRLTSLVGELELAKALEPRRRNFTDERVVHDLIRTKVATALRHLQLLGFVDLPDADHIRPRAAIMRFADPVRDLQDKDSALERLLSEGRIATDEDEAEHEAEDVEE